MTPTRPASWRPITLLNTDHKLAATLLSRRLRAWLPELVSPYQSSSVPGRSVFASLTLIRDVFAYACAKDVSGAFLALDQAKAIDSVDHGYLFAVLRCFRLPERFIGILAVLYSDLLSDLVLNGDIVSGFAVTRGVRQGCPLSPALFVLALDLLLRKVMADRRIRRVPMVGQETIVVSAYADDISVFVRDSESFRVFLATFAEYASLSGAQLNTNKSHALRFGSFTGPLAADLNFVNAVRALGVLSEPTGVSVRVWDDAV